MLGVTAIEGKQAFADHIVEWCYRLSSNKKTLTVAPRKHLKTTTNLGYLAWKLYRLDRKYYEADYMAYTGDLAEHQLKRGKRIIEAIPKYFNDFKSQTDASSIWNFKKGENEFFCQPSGILTFKRGKHPHIMILDDVLKDPKSSLQLGTLEEITRIFDDEIQSMPTEELHIFGTPQDREDLFYHIEQKGSFNCKRYPAVIDYNKKDVLWPEAFPFEELMKIKADIGEKSFNKEFQCRPVRSEEGFFNDEELDSVICPRLKNRSVYQTLKLNEYTYAGLDIGKKRHPSHLSIFGRNKKKHLVQIASIWLDGVDYKDQISICSEAIKSFNIMRLFYDDTRAEFEGFREVGELPPQMKGVSFTSKKKYQMAVDFEKEVNNKSILMINDKRQKKQILNVDNSLTSLETSDGHGDSFWSNALAISASKDSGVNIRFI